MSTTQDTSTAEPTAGQSTPGGGSGDTPAGTQTDQETTIESGAEAAMDRAQARLSGEAGESTPTGSEQATTGDTPAGESTQNNKPGEGSDQETSEAAAGAPEGETGEGETGEAGETDGGELEADSTVEIPEDFPADRKAEIEKLPIEAQRIVLDTYKDMQAGLTKATQSISEITKAHGDIVNAMQESGMDGERVVDLVNTAQAFDSDPEGVLRQLAEQKGLEVFFSAEEAAGEIPQEVLNDPAKYAKYIQDQTTKQIRREEQRKAEADKQAAAQKAAQDKLKDEFQQAASTFEDFKDHQPAVIAKLQDVGNEGLSVHDAYKLATYDQVREMADRTAKAESEVKRLTGELETLQKGGTVLVQGNDGQQSNDELEGLDPAERAYVKAQRRLEASRQFAPS